MQHKLINHISATLGNQQTNAISLRDLYVGLELSTTQYNRWVRYNILRNEFFIQGRDWEVLDMKSSTEKGGQIAQDYIISIDFAKHITMMAKTQKAHEYRNYLIALENTFKYIEFKKTDKKHQLNAMEIVHDILTEDEKKIAVNYIKANTVVNKLTSDIHHRPTMIKKNQMSPDELKTRQKVLDDYVAAFELTTDNSLTNDVLRTIYIKQNILKGDE